MTFSLFTKRDKIDEMGFYLAKDIRLKDFGLF